MPRRFLYGMGLLACGYFSLSAWATGDAAVSGEVMVFHAGSLSVPFKQIAEAFQKEYPSVRVLSEASGSRDCARKITELDRRCDVMAASD
ncbi:MAG TPA: substrate-binding domain-containing protein [Candidatus Bathyarchaeia archaeon]|nr:substrate-binding domain-containing protein [Candidatus Bathyarchaeia archaeon]